MDGSHLGCYSRGAHYSHTVHCVSFDTIDSIDVDNQYVFTTAFAIAVSVAADDVDRDVLRVPVNRMLSGASVVASVC